MVKRYFVIFSLILIYFENVRAQEIAYCNNNGKCGQIRNYNLLIKLPCTEYEFNFDGELIQKFLTKSYELVNNSKLCDESNKKETKNLDHLYNNSKQIDENSNHNQSLVKKEVIKNNNEVSYFIYSIFDEVNDYISYLILIFFFAVFTYLRTKISIKNIKLRLKRKKINKKNNNLYEADKDIRLYPNLDCLSKLTAPSIYQTIDTALFKIESENIEVIPISAIIVGTNVDNVFYEKSCSSVTSCNNNRCGCVKSGRKCNEKCHKNMINKNCVNF